MTDLITKLETAESGSRELSDEVLFQLGWVKYNDDDDDDWVMPDGKLHGYYDPQKNTWWTFNPSPTESVDDALGLVPEGWAFELTILHEPRASGSPSLVWGKSPSEGVVWPPHTSMPVSRGKTPALALCAAILRAQNKE